MFRLLVFFSTAVLFAAPLSAQNETNSDWKTILQERIPLYGHRNWIIVADSAYPAQSAAGIETVVSNADQFQVLQAALQGLENSRHVRPAVYLDRELNAVEENDAPGISAYREQLSSTLGDKTVHRELLHEQIISKLAQVSQNFRVLIIKTNSTLPYSSVFLELGPAYWSPDAERRLRSRLSEHPRK